MEEEAEAYFEKIKKLGGVIQAIELGFFQKEIAKAASVYQREIDAKDRIIVGVNEYVEEDENVEIPILTINPRVEKDQIASMRQVKAERSETEAQAGLSALRQSATDGSNLMPHFVNCARNYVTLGEMVQVLREEFGEYLEVAMF